MSRESAPSIEEIALAIRDVFERMLQSSIHAVDTQGTCLYGSIFLSQSLNQFANVKCRVTGGGPPMDGGYTDRRGRVHGHYWVSGITADGQPFVADITADQFGDEPIQVFFDAADRGRYHPGNQAVVDEHVALELREVKTSIAQEQSIGGHSCATAPT